MFITNRHNQYFEIDRAASIDISKLSDCLVHKTKHAMLSHIGTQTDLTIEELENHEISIKYCELRQCYDHSDGHAGVMSEVELDEGETIESFISDFIA